MSLNRLIAKKNSDVEKSDNQTSDRISPDGGYPSLGKEPETRFARKDVVKYSLTMHVIGTFLSLESS